MPITQDRMIRIVAHADAMLTIFDQLKQTVRAAASAELFTRANSVLARTQDLAAAGVLQDLKDALGTIYNLFADLEIPYTMRENIVEERTHFKSHRRANESLAIYRRLKRHNEEQMFLAARAVHMDFSSPAGSEASRDEPTQASAQAPEPRKVHRPLTGESKDDSPDYKVVDRNNIFPPGETPTPLTSVAVAGAAVQSNTTVNTIAKPVQTQAKTYDPDVISTSVPAAIDLYAAPPQGEDLL